MSAKKLIVIILIMLTDFTYSQSGEHDKLSEVCLGFNNLKYMNSYIVPSGLSADGYSIRYSNFRNSLNSHTAFSARLNHNKHFDNEFINLSYYNPFYITELKINIYRSRKIPTSISNFHFLVGAAFSLNGNLLNTKFSYTHRDGYWSTSADIHSSITKTIKPFNIQYQIRIPIITTGNFDEYQNSIFSYDFGRNLRFYALPNFLTSVTGYTEIENNFSVLYSLKYNKRLKVKLNYEFTYLNTNIHNNLIRKKSNELSIGLIILKQ